MWYLLGVKKNCLDYAHKTEFWYLLGVLFKVSDDHPYHFNMEVPPPPSLEESLKSHLACPATTIYHFLGLYGYTPLTKE